MLELHTSSISTILNSQVLFNNVLQTKTDEQTTHQVSYQSLLNHGSVSAGLSIKPGSSRGFLQRSPVVP